MRDSDVDLYTFARLRDEFGSFDAGDSDGLGHVERELVGARYHEILRELTAIVRYQWKEHMERSALKGFLLHGGVGVGKTAMAKRLTYELCRRFGDSGAMERKLDDVESLFLTRNSTGAKEWHFSQNSIFFHSIDELDTAHTAVILTTNRIDLVDEAIVDRFLGYEFAPPPVSVLEEVAREKAKLQRFTEEDLQPVLNAIRAPEAVKSIREIERMVMRAYVAKLLKRPIGNPRGS